MVSSPFRVTIVAAVLLGLLVAVLSSSASVHAVQVVHRGAAEPQATATPAVAPTGAAAAAAATPSNQTASAGGAPAPAVSNQTSSEESASASGSGSSEESASASGSTSASASASASASSESSASVHSTTETREETYSLKTNAIGEQVSSEPKIDEALEDSVPRHEGSAEHGADDVAVTLARLGTVLNKMFVQVENDEHMFKVFKDKVLEDEISKSDVDLSWPAVKDLVRSEVRLGRQKIENEVNNFKVELLDVVQRGLGDLRASLRATITTGFIAPSESLAHAAAAAATAAAASEESSEASSEESSAAAPSVSVQIKKGASIDAEAEPAKDAAAPGDAPNADVEGDDMVSNNDAYEGVASPLDAVSRALGTHMDAKDVLEVRQLVLEKLAQHEQKNLAAKKAAPQAAVGVSADEALADLRRELAGKDLKGEVASKIEAVRHDAAATKSEATNEALRRLETSLGGESSAATTSTVPTGNELLDRLQHRLDGLLARTQRIQQDRADVDAAAAAAAPVAGAASAASNPFIVEAVDVTHGDAAGDGRVEADLKTSGVTPAIKEEGVKVEFAN